MSSYLNVQKNLGPYLNSLYNSHNAKIKNLFWELGPPGTHLKTRIFYFSIFIFLIITSYQMVYRSCCDARGYEIIAEHYARGGFFKNILEMENRTYLYPLVMTPWALLTRAFTPISTSFLIGLFQITLFCSALVFVHKKLPSTMTAWRNPLLVGFGCNFFLYPYLSLPLTEGLSLTCTFFVLVQSFIFIDEGAKNLKRLCLILFSVFSLVEIRPANIYLSTVAILLIIFYFRAQSHRSLVAKAKCLSKLWLTSIIPFAPQVLQNWIVFQKLSLFSSSNLRDAQIQWGKEYLKYGTLMLNGGGPLNFYNPFYSKISDVYASSIDWYLHNPLSGAATLVGHIMASLDIDSLFTYIYNPRPFYRWPMALLGHAIVISIFICIRLIRKNQIITFDKSEKVLQATIMMTLFALTWALTIAFTAAEVRFGLPIFILGGPCFYIVATQWKVLRHLGKYEIACCALYLVSAIAYGLLFDHQRNLFLNSINWPI